MKVYTCPDCGMKFNEGFVPSECSNCGCPSSEFQLQEIKNEEGTNSNGDNKIIQFFLLIIVIGIVCGGGYAIYSASQQKAQKAEQERYELREKERVQRERNEQIKRQEESNAAYQELLRTGKEFENACNIYNRELNMIADKATSSAYSGVYAQKIFWDCDDAFQLVEKKGAAFARAMRKCGQEDNARELERRLKADRRKYNSYKDEVNHMLGIY